jgi:MFS family permease
VAPEDGRAPGRGDGLLPTYLAGAGHMIAGSAMTPLLPLYAVMLGASPAVIGVVAASSAVLPFLLGIWAGAGTDVLGARRMIQIGAGLHTASALVVASAPAIPLVVLGAATAGLATNVMVIAGQTSVAHQSAPEDWDKNYGVYAFWYSAGQVLGPLAGGFLADSYSIRAAFYACAAVAALPLLFASWIPRQATRAASNGAASVIWAREVHRSVWQLMKRRDLRFILSIAFLIIFAWSIKSSFLPLYLQAVGLPKAEIGLIYSCLGVGAMIIRPLIGALIGRFGRRRVLLSAVVLGAVAIGAIPFLRQFLPLAIVVLAGGVAWGITQPVTMSMMAGSVDVRERGLALSLRVTSNRLGEVVSPVVFGLLVTLTGLAGAFAVAALALGVGVVVIARSAKTVGF